MCNKEVLKENGNKKITSNHKMTAKTFATNNEEREFEKFDTHRTYLRQEQQGNSY